MVRDINFGTNDVVLHVFKLKVVRSAYGWTVNFEGSVLAFAGSLLGSGRSSTDDVNLAGWEWFKVKTRQCYGSESNQGRIQRNADVEMDDLP